MLCGIFYRFLNFHVIVAIVVSHLITLFLWSNPVYKYIQYRRKITEDIEMSAVKKEEEKKDEPKKEEKKGVLNWFAKKEKKEEVKKEEPKKEEKKDDAKKPSWNPFAKKETK